MRKRSATSASSRAQALLREMIEENPKIKRRDFIAAAKDELNVTENYASLLFYKAKASLSKCLED